MIRLIRLIKLIELNHGPSDNQKNHSFRQLN